MATQGCAQPSAKKRSFVFGDLFKLCRSISVALPRDKPNHHHIDKPNHHHIDKPKHQQKLRTDSKRNGKPEFHVPNDPRAFNSQEVNKVEGVSLCNVRSYRFDSTDIVGSKKSSSLSRSFSHNTASTTTSMNPSMRKSKSSSNTIDPGFMPTLMRSTTTVQRSHTNTILYSSSSARVAKPPPTEEKLSCTLEELCNGCTKKIKIKREVITSSRQMREEEETVEIKVRPGWKGGTKVTFEGKGNEAMGSVPADLTFVIVEKEHQVFRREGDDLEMAVEVSLLEALTGFELSVALPDGDNLSLKIDDVIHPGYVTVIQGKGMPNPKEKGKKRGDLRIRFQTKFPQQLTNDQRTEIQSILQDSS